MVQSSTESAGSWVHSTAWSWDQYGSVDQASGFHALSTADFTVVRMMHLTCWSTVRSCQTTNRTTFASDCTDCGSSHLAWNLQTWDSASRHQAPIPRRNHSHCRHCRRAGRLHLNYAPYGGCPYLLKRDDLNVHECLEIVCNFASLSFPFHSRFGLNLHHKLALAHRLDR